MQTLTKLIAITTVLASSGLAQANRSRLGMNTFTT